MLRIREQQSEQIICQVDDWDITRSLHISLLATCGVLPGAGISDYPDTAQVLAILRVMLTTR